MGASFAGLLFSDRNLLSSFALTFSFSPISGRVPPVHRGPAAARQVLCVHVVQPAGGQEEVLQEAREEDVPRGGAQVQGRAHGEWALTSAFSVHLLLVINTSVARPVGVDGLQRVRRGGGRAGEGA